MIRYSLSCDNDHAFESWFQSAEAFDKLTAAAMVGCPDCGSSKIVKALMAPQVRPARNRAERPLAGAVTEREKALAELRRQVEENSEYVGLSFAAEARAIHDGDAPERPIWGEAKPSEARALIEDGIAAVPLPFLPQRKQH